jgi:hypothetical protein
MSLTETGKTHGVATQPGSTVRSSLGTIGAVSAFAKSSGLASCRSKSTAFAVLVHRVTDPVDASIVTDLGVGRINKDYFVVLHGSILVNPVRVEYTEVGELTSDLLLSNRLKISLEFKVVDTLVLRFSKYHTTVILTLTTSTTDSNAYYNISLLSLVTKTVSLLGTGRFVATDHLRALTVLPRTDTKEETECITLLVTPKLFHILVSSHDVKLQFLKNKWKCEIK